LATARRRRVRRRRLNLLPAASDAGAGVAEIERRSEEWDALADRAGASPFLRPGWIAAWWRAFGRGRLEILTAESGGRLEAVLPVVHRHGGIHAPSNWHTPQYGLLEAARGAGSGMVGELFAAAPQVSLGFVSSLTAEVQRYCDSAHAHRYRTLVRTQERSPLVVMDGDWESYERGLSTGLRRDLRRCRRRLGEHGRVWLDVHEDVSRLGEALELERLGWKEQAGTAIASRPETQQFYTDVAHWASQRGWLRLIFLRVDERAVAFQFALEDGCAHLGLKSGFDPQFRAMSPGRLIVEASLEHAFAIGLKRFEFMGTADAYKLRFANDTYDRLLFQAFAPRPAGQVLYGAFAYGRPLAKRAQAEARRVRERVASAGARLASAGARPELRTGSSQSTLGG
jgi:CelD/BcsL family acetyltransferase involved in cellulose biosynthesis